MQCHFINIIILQCPRYTRRGFTLLSNGRAMANLGGAKDSITGQQCNATFGTVTHLGLQFFFNSSHTHIIGCHTTDTLLQDNFTGQFFVLNTSQLLILSVNPVTTASLMENTEYDLLFLHPQYIPHGDYYCVLRRQTQSHYSSSAQILG